MTFGAAGTDYRAPKDVLLHSSERSNYGREG